MKGLSTIALCLFAALPTLAQADGCPSDTVHLVGQYPGVSGLHVSNRPSEYFANHIFYTSPPTTSTQRGVYDLVAGRIEAAAYGTCAVNVSALTADVQVATHDVYRLVGPMGPDAVPFTARLQLHVFAAGDTFSSRGTGYWIPAGLIESQLGESGTTRVASLRLRERINATRELTLPLSRMAGETFVLRMFVRTQATAGVDNSTDEGFPRYAEASGVLTFPDLPPGYSVTSCQGFDSSAPVLLQPSTWGRIKVLFR